MDSADPCHWWRADVAATFPPVFAFSAGSAILAAVGMILIGILIAVVMGFNNK